MSKSELPEEIQRMLVTISEMSISDIDYEIIELVVGAAYIKGRIYQADKGVF